MSGESSVYRFKDYRHFLAHWIQQPSPNRGKLSRLSEAATIHKSTLSQVLNGHKDLSLEQAQRVAQYLGLSESEGDYFLLLVNLARAGTPQLKGVFQRQIKRVQSERMKLKHRVTRSRELTSEERAIYYSNWTYSAVRNASAIPGLNERLSIAKHLGIPPELCARVLRFLLEHGLCLDERGKLRPGPPMTHLEASSPLVARHHGNWRVKAMERHPMLRPHELAYTAPMTLSARDAERIRELLSELVESTDKIVRDSPSEKLYCICLDWFEVS